MAGGSFQQSQTSLEVRSRAIALRRGVSSRGMPRSTRRHVAFCQVPCQKNGVCRADGADLQCGKHHSNQKPSKKFRQIPSVCGFPFATTEGEKKGRKTCHRLPKPAKFGVFVDRENGAVREGLKRAP